MNAELSRSEIEEILRKDPKILAVHWPQEYVFGTVNRDLWSKDVETREKHIHSLEEYLKRPCVEDTFRGDYFARKQWKGQYREGEWGVNWLWYKDRDALKWGSMRVIPSLSEWLLENYIGPNSESIQSIIPKIREIIPKTFNEYDKNTTARKIEIVAQLKEILYQVLQHFYEPRSVSLN